MRVRIEFWKLSPTSSISVALLDSILGDAIEIDANDTDITLPSSNIAYAMSVYGIEGAAIVECSAEPTGSQAGGRLVPEGSQHWFKVDPGEKLSVVEYTGII